MEAVIIAEEEGISAAKLDIIGRVNCIEVAFVEQPTPPETRSEESTL